MYLLMHCTAVNRNNMHSIALILCVLMHYLHRQKKTIELQSNHLETSEDLTSIKTPVINTRTRDQ